MVDLVDPVEGLRITLPQCENVAQFAALVESHPVEVVEKAIALADSQPRRKQLEAWFEQLAQQEEVSASPPLEFYAEGDEVWIYHPSGEAKWIRGVVEWVRDRMVRVKAGFLGRLIEKADQIAPGHWVLGG